MEFTYNDTAYKVNKVVPTLLNSCNNLVDINVHEPALSVNCTHNNISRATHRSFTTIFKLKQPGQTGVMKMAIINMVTARHFKRKGKVFESGLLSAEWSYEEIAQRRGMAMGLAMLDRLLCAISS